MDSAECSFSVLAHGSPRLRMGKLRETNNKTMAHSAFDEAGDAIVETGQAGAPRLLSRNHGPVGASGFADGSTVGLPRISVLSTRNEQAAIDEELYGVDAFFFFFLVCTQVVWDSVARLACRTGSINH